MKQKGSPETELSRLLQVDKIPAGGIEEHIVARPTERAALAKRFGLLDLPMLEAMLNVDHAPRQMLVVTGTLRARVVQQCVVTLEPVPAQIEDAIDLLFAPTELLEPGANPQHTDELESEAPEPIVNGAIDLGELVAQHLAVALDPYPRKNGAVFATPPVAKETPVSSNPFVQLKRRAEDKLQ